MGPPGIVETQVTADRSPRLAHRCVGAQVDLFVLHRTSQSLDDDIVAPRAATIHADGNAPLRQKIHLSRCPDSQGRLKMQPVGHTRFYTTLTDATAAHNPMDRGDRAAFDSLHKSLALGAIQ